MVLGETMALEAHKVPYDTGMAYPVTLSYLLVHVLFMIQVRINTYQDISYTWYRS